MKLIMENWRQFILEQTIVEATDEEIETIRPALDLPVEKLPFNYVFDDKYRKLLTFQGNDKDSEFSKFLNFLQLTGWSLDPSDCSMAIKSRDTSFIAKPQDGVKTRTKLEKIKLTKLMQEMKYQFEFKFMSYCKKLFEIRQEMIEHVRKEHDKNYKGGSYNREWLSNKKYLNLSREKIALQNSIEKFVNKESALQLFPKIYEAQWSSIEGVLNSPLIPRSKQYFEYVENNIEAFKGKSLEELSNKTFYVVLSRHPIDVFRMADHVSMDSCHSLPSGKGKDRFDEYNICAMAEAHGNGMIAYVVDVEEFKDFGIEPSQEALDEFEDGEIFYDEERGKDGLVPISRIRVRNVGVLNDKYSHYDIENRIAVPDGDSKVYGQKIPGFSDFLYKKMSEIQKDKLQSIIKKSNGKIDFSNFLRVGGSYQDNSYSGGVRANIIKMIDLVDPSAEIDFVGEVQYSSDLEDSLASQYKGTSIESARETLNSLIAQFSNNTVNFEALSVEEGWDEEFPILLSGEIRIIWPYGDEIQSYESAQQVQSAIEDAISIVEDYYFPDDNWFTDLTVLFDRFLFGYNNCMVISIPISNYTSEHNEFYFEWDPDTWDEALRDLSSKLYNSVDRHIDDSLNNLILHHISYHNPTIKTNVSHEYALTHFKDKLEDEGLWEIEDVEIDEDWNISEKVTSFMATKLDGLWLGELFSDLNSGGFDPDDPKIVEGAKRLSISIMNLMNALKSNEMNIFKASLLHTELANNLKLYEYILKKTFLSNLQFNVETFTNGDEIEGSQQILENIIADNDLDLQIKIKVDENWGPRDFDTIGEMMLGNFDDNVGWHTDTQETLKSIVISDAATKPASINENKKNIKRKVKIKILKG